MIGVGEGIDDLRDFDPAAFVDALLGYEVSAPSISWGSARHALCIIAVEEDRELQ